MVVRIVAACHVTRFADFESEELCRHYLCWDEIQHNVKHFTTSAFQFASQFELMCGNSFRLWTNWSLTENFHSKYLTNYEELYGINILIYIMPHG
jgi:hypothetical protein